VLAFTLECTACSHFGSSLQGIKRLASPFPFIMPKAVKAMKAMKATKKATAPAPAAKVVNQL
jgi:hypothetical protein